MPEGFTLGDDFESDEPGLLEAAGGGLVLGASRDPFLSPLVGLGFSDEQLADLEARLQNSRISDVAEVVGEYGTLFAGGIGAFSAGRAAAGAVLRAAGSRGLLGRAGAAAASRGATSAATGLPEAAAALTPLESFAQAAGGNLAVGAFEGSRELAGGASLGEAAQTAAITTLLGTGFDLGLRGAARVLGTRVRPGAGDETLERFGSLQTFRKRGEKLAASREKVQEELTNLSRRLDEVTSAPEMARDMTTARSLEKKIGRRQRALRRIETDIGANLDAQDLRNFNQDMLLGDPGEFNPDGQYRQLLDRFANWALRTPEAVAGRLGVSVSNFVQRFDNMEIGLQIGRQAITKKLDDSVRAVGGLDVFEEVMELAEAQGLEAVRLTRGRAVADAIEPVLDAVARKGQEAARVRGTALLTPAQLERFGVAMYLPQRLKEGAKTQQELVEVLVRRGLDRDVAEERAVAIWSNQFKGTRGRALGRFANLDERREFAGTLGQKRREGAPMKSYLESVSDYLNGVDRSVGFAKLIGVDEKRGIETLVKAAAEEGASATAAQSFLDGLLGREPFEYAQRRLAQNVTSLQSALKLTLAVLPNLGQQTNNAIFAGSRNALRGSLQSLKGRDLNANAARAVALFDTEMDLYRRVLGGVEGENFLDKFARSVLTATQFDRVERWNRLSSALTTNAMINDVIARGVRGQLRGATGQTALRRMRSIGLDMERLFRGAGRDTLERVLASGGSFEDVVNGVFGRDAYARALMKGSRATQYIPGRTRVPLAWQTPLGRVLTQFKSFALNQGIFVRDAVLGEYAQGNVKPLATMLGLYPIAGELVNQALDVARDRETTRGPDRLLLDLTTVGGFGLAQSVLTAADSGRLGNFLLGPTATDLIEMVTNVATLDAEGLVNQVGRQPAIRDGANALLGVGTGGFAAVDAINGMFETEPADEVLSLEEFSQLR